LPGPRCPQRGEAQSPRPALPLARHVTVHIPSARAGNPRAHTLRCRCARPKHRASARAAAHAHCPLSLGPPPVHAEALRRRVGARGTLPDAAQSPHSAPTLRDCECTTLWFTRKPRVPTHIVPCARIRAGDPQQLVHHAQVPVCGGAVQRCPPILRRCAAESTRGSTVSRGNMCRVITRCDAVGETAPITRSEQSTQRACEFMIAGSLSGPASATHICLCAHVDARCPQQRLHNGVSAARCSAVTPPCAPPRSPHALSGSYRSLRRSFVRAQSR
jgi:hypothetical protein